MLCAVCSRSRYYNLPYGLQAGYRIQKALLHEVCLPFLSFISAVLTLACCQVRARRIRYSGRSPNRLVVITEAGRRSYVIRTIALASPDSLCRYLNLNGLTPLSPGDRDFTKLTPHQVCFISLTSTCLVPEIPISRS